jgi:hypothetical protein
MVKSGTLLCAGAIAALLGVACGGKSTTPVAIVSGAAGGPGTALPDSGSAGGPSNTASGGASNGAITPELQSAGVSLDAVLGQLDAASMTRLCTAMGAQQFRLAPESCLAFIESAVILEPRSQEEDRLLCASLLAQNLCHSPDHETPYCASIAKTCTATVRELDQCLADQEQWLTAVPTCQEMTRATAPDLSTSAQSSCQLIAPECWDH